MVDAAPASAKQSTGLSRRAMLTGLGAGGAAAVFVRGAEPAAAATATTSGPPSYMPSAALNTFETTTSVYNFKASNTRRHRAGLALASGGGLTNQVFIGDSLTAGCIGGTTFDRLNAWPRVYAATLNQLGIPNAGTGLVRVADNTVVDARWTFSSGWAGYTSCSYAAAAGATATFSSDVAGTSVAVAYQQGAGGGAFTVSVDGATSGPGFASVSTGGSTKATRVTLSGLPDTTHLVTVTTASSAMVVLIGAEVFNPSGLICHNVGQSGSRASGTGRPSWSDTTTAGGSAQPLTIYRSTSGIYGQIPSTVHCALGINDLIAGATPDAVVAAIATIRAQCAGSDFFLYLEPQPNAVTPDNWSALCTAMYGAADSLDVPLFDLQDRLGGYSSEQLNQLTGDTYAHLDRAGYADWGRSSGLISSR